MKDVLEKGGHPSIAVIPKGQWAGNPDPFLHIYSEYSPFPGNYSSLKTVMGIYEKMLLDDKVSQVLGAVNSAVKTLDWYLDSSDPEASSFIGEALEQMNLRRFIAGLLTARVYGFAVFEEVWKPVSGRYIIAEERLLSARKVEFVTDEFAQLVSLKYDGREFPVEWFHVFTYPEVLPETYYYGQSDLRKIYREWYNKDILKRYRNLGLENFAFPMAVVTYDENRYRQGTPEWDALQSMVAGLKDDARVTLPGTFDPAGRGLMPGVEIRFLEPGFSGGGFEAFEKAIESENKAISRNLGLPDDLGFTDTPAGSYAKSRQEFDLFWKTVTDLAETVAASIQKTVDRLTAYNFPGDKVRFGFDLSREKGLNEQKAAILKALSDAGVKFDPAFIGRYLNIAETELLPAE